MTEAEARWRNSIGVTLGIHIFAAVLIGILGFRFVSRPPEILEVSIIGGGGAPVAAQQEEEPEETLVRRPDDIIDPRLQPEIKPEKKPRREEKAVADEQPAPFSGESSTEGAAAGPGLGAGEGEAAGDGSGRGVPTTPPRVLSSVQPKYPASARSQGIQGVTAVKMLVNVDGRVEEAFVVLSSGCEALDQSALEAVYKWRFSPARDKFGQKAPCYVTQGVRFDLGK